MASARPSIALLRAHPQAVDTALAGALLVLAAAEIWIGTEPSEAPRAALTLAALLATPAPMAASSTSSSGPQAGWRPT